MAPRAESYQRTRRDDWLFGAIELRLTLSELTAALALHPHMDDETLRAWPGLARMAAYAGCDATKIKRGLRGLIGRGAMMKDVGGGAGNLTIYTGVIPPRKTGSAPPRRTSPANPSPAKSAADQDDGDPDPVFGVGSYKEPGSKGRKTGSKTGSETGSASRARVPGTVEQVEQSTPRFARSGPTDGAVGPRAEEKQKDFVWRIAKAFPSKRRFLDGVVVLNEWLDAGTTSRAELVARLEVWGPWFADLHQMNGHWSGYTVRGWLESGDFRFDPREVHDWTPPDDDEGLERFP